MGAFGEAASFGPRDDVRFARVEQRKPFLAHLLEERARQFPIGDAQRVAGRFGSQIGAGPDEAVAFRDDDPGAGVVETKAPFRGGGNLDSMGGMRSAACG